MDGFAQAIDFLCTLGETFEQHFSARGLRSRGTYRAYILVCDAQGSTVTSQKGENLDGDLLSVAH